MVTFKEKSVVIEITTGSDPKEYHKQSLSSLIQILKMQDESFGNDLGRYNYYLLDLLQSMIDVKEPVLYGK